ncbi:MAG: ABC transporter ATP-binding protein [Bacilli bacterium]|nr:ABC transporter ATP-binding protein [Bacilli bacterium]MDD3304708.1 ABC transporter ATP-binding protein [Bacilli bacterium]MDD4053613.1 ABC transporter ATP-binding protein [Bacilli bacterium]MDD4411112.1 ABC transporter ATP-binding protein [Bacilli bacterium]
MIEITNVTKRFDKTAVLEHLNCKIEKGSIYGLVGANGAGKSTLLRLIMGIYKQDEGTILVDGVESFDNPLIKQKMAFVPDDLFFYSGYSLYEMAVFYQSIYDNFDMDYFKELCDLFRLDINRKVSTFSKGMKRQGALIVAIATKASYLFFDETFDGLDPVIRNLVKKIICESVAKDNTTIILTSHNLRELEDTCDHLGLLYKGGILFERDVDTLKTEMFKVQISLSGDFDEAEFKNLEIMSFKKKGSVTTLILKGNKEKIKVYLEKKNPIILDFIPLTLEEIFIYEMEVLGYEFESVIL